MWPCTFHAPKKLCTETCRLQRVSRWTDVGRKIQEKGKVCVFQLGTRFLILVERELSGINSGAWKSTAIFDRCHSFYRSILVYDQHHLSNFLFYKMLCFYFVSIAFFNGLVALPWANNKLIWLKANMPLTICISVSPSYLPRLDF